MPVGTRGDNYRPLSRAAWRRWSSPCGSSSRRFAISRRARSRSTRKPGARSRRRRWWTWPRWATSSAIADTRAVTVRRSRAAAKPQHAAIAADEKRVFLPPKEDTYGNIEGLMQHFKLVMYGHGVRPPKGEVYFPVEGANGELGFYVVSDGTEQPLPRARPSALLCHHVGAAQAPHRGHDRRHDSHLRVGQHDRRRARPVNLAALEAAGPGDHPALRPAAGSDAAALVARPGELRPYLSGGRSLGGTPRGSGGRPCARGGLVLHDVPHQTRGPARASGLHEPACLLRGAEDVLARHQGAPGRSARRDDAGRGVDAHGSRVPVRLRDCAHGPARRAVRRAARRADLDTFSEARSRNRQAATPLPEPEPFISTDGPVLSTRFKNPEGTWWDAYVADGGYLAAKKALISMTPAADHRRGLARPTCAVWAAPDFRPGRKWSFIPKDDPKPKYLVVNADEGEPGTFKDRYILERDPHALLEGMIIAAYAIGSHKAYVYIRGEYFRPAQRFSRAVDEAYAQGWLGKNIQGSGFDLDVVDPSRGGSLYLRRRDGAAHFPRRRERVSQAQAALPRHLRSLPVPDDRQQRRDARLRSIYPARWRRALRRPRHGQAGRHAALLA